MIEKLQDVCRERHWEDSTLRISDMVSRIEARLENHLPEGQHIALTKLQKKALNDPLFWSNWTGDRQKAQDLIIQGATSSGKTLLSELSILDCLAHSKNALVLVPLKAMVRERTHRFKHDIQDPQNNNNLTVYGSSSDLLDHDEDLIAGIYSVGILVYEKLFAMLSQPNCRILDDCGLIVVDELSMLSKEERGPKLEMALEMARELAHKRHQDLRIICLATIDCKVTHIGQWLANMNAGDEESCVHVIKTPERPVGLNEYLVTLDGHYDVRHIRGENEPDSTKEDDDKGCIPGYNVRPGSKTTEKRRSLLIAILRYVMGERENEEKPEKLLIFVPSQQGTRIVADYLIKNASELFPEGEISKTLRNRLDQCDIDDDLIHMRDHLLVHGIAYHHSSISSGLREAIEENFQDPHGCIRAIVATETLTVGINMPIDCMIITNEEVPKGVGAPVRLTKQEYRNYIGRAGRLGLTAKKRGESYFMLSRSSLVPMYWDNFQNGGYTDMEEIDSALGRAGVEEQAPYYLGLLAGTRLFHDYPSTLRETESFNDKDVQQLQRKSLSSICNRSEFNASELLTYLKDYKLIEKYWAGLPKTYVLTRLGTSLAPFALSLDAAYQIQKFFLSSGTAQQETVQEETVGGLPCNITASDIIQDQYLLDILFSICIHPELQSSSLLMIKKGARPEDENNLNAKIYRALYEMLDGDILKQKHLKVPEKTCDITVQLWPNSMIEKLFLNFGFTPGEIWMQALMRSILMVYWTKGKTVNEIQKLTGFGQFVRFSNGDLERFAEVVSFHLEAVYRSLPCRMGNDDALPNEFYHLSSRVKYGVPQEGVVIANRHIAHLSRHSILKLVAVAKKDGVTPVDYLTRASNNNVKNLGIQPEQRRKILERLEVRYFRSNRFSVLLEKCHEVVNIAEIRSALEELYAWDGQHAERFIENLRNVVMDAPDQCLYCCNRIKARGIYGLEWWYRSDQRTIKLLIGILTESDRVSSNEREVIELFQKYKKDEIRILLASDSTVTGNYDLQDSGIEKLRRFYQNSAQFDLGLLCSNFAMLILQTIIQSHIRAKNMAEILFEVLQDTRGIPMELNYTWQNFWTEQEKCENPPRFQVLYDANDQEDSFSGRLLARLKQEPDLADFRILPWGTALDQGAFCTYPTVILCGPRTICSSHSLHNFLYTQSQATKYSCIALPDSKETEHMWDNTASDGELGLRWSTKYKKCPHVYYQDLEQQVQQIRTFLGLWQRQAPIIAISYAHDQPDDRIIHDIKLIHTVAERLYQVYGMDRVLFDGNPYFSWAFVGDQSKSLALYAACKLTLVLYNYETAVNKNCNKEREAVKEAGGEIWYLQTGQPDDPALPDNIYSFSFVCNTIDGLLQAVDRQLAEENNK